MKTIKTIHTNGNVSLVMTTKFANELLYEMMTTDSVINLPNYIKDSFEYIKSKLEK